MGDVQDKSDAYAALGDEDVQDYLASMVFLITKSNVTANNEPIHKTIKTEKEHGHQSNLRKGRSKKVLKKPSNVLSQYVIWSYQLENLFLKGLDKDRTVSSEDTS